jgi:hypothetical protein
MNFKVINTGSLNLIIIITFLKTLSIYSVSATQMKQMQNSNQMNGSYHGGSRMMTPGSGYTNGSRPAPMMRMACGESGKGEITGQMAEA